MFLSRLNDIVEPRDRAQKDSLVFKQFKVSFQNFEVFVFLFDLLLIAFSSVSGNMIYQYFWPDDFATADTSLSAGLINGLLYVYAVSRRGMYRLPVVLKPVPNTSQLLTIFAFVAFLATGIVFLIKGNMTSFFWPLVTTLLLQIILLLNARVVFAITTRVLLSMGLLDGRRVVTIGEPAELMGLNPSFLLHCFGRKEVFRVPVTMSRGYRSIEVLANLDEAIAHAREQGAEEFLIALRWGSQELLETVRSRLRTSPLPVRLLPDHSMRTLLGPRRRSTDPLLFPITLQRVRLTNFEKAVKRALDTVGSITAIVFFWPLFLIAAVAVKLDSPGPILVRQRRRGFDAKEFLIFGFRTMPILKDGPVVEPAYWDDRRVTPLGKLLRRSGIDELPQLFNVLKGDMSLVGPRPHALGYDDEYTVHIADHALHRHVKPGMTGWAQVNGLRSETMSFEKMAERLKLDLWYLNNWSLGLDINILLKTCIGILRER